MAEKYRSSDQIDIYPYADTTNYFFETHGLFEGFDECDWEYVTASDPDRVHEYLDYLKSHEQSMTENQRVTLMTIIFSSIDDDLSAPFKFAEPSLSEEMKLALRRLKEMVFSDWPLYFAVADYWACWDNDNLEDAFSIAGFARGLFSEKPVRHERYIEWRDLQRHSTVGLKYFQCEINALEKIYPPKEKHPFYGMWDIESRHIQSIKQLTGVDCDLSKYNYYLCVNLYPV